MLYSHLIKAWALHCASTFVAFGCPSGEKDRSHRCSRTAASSLQIAIYRFKLISSNFGTLLLVGKPCFDPLSGLVSMPMLEWNIKSYAGTYEKALSEEEEENAAAKEEIMAYSGFSREPLTITTPLLSVYMVHGKQNSFMVEKIFKKETIFLLLGR